MKTRPPEKCRIKMLGTDGHPVWLVRVEDGTPFTERRMAKAPTFERAEAEGLVTELKTLRNVRRPELVPELNANC